jgi:SAM-dependent methyltransferase
MNMRNTAEQCRDLAASFFDVLIRQLVEQRQGPLKILDFGCGSGQLVATLRTLGYDAYGCDTWGRYSHKPPADERLREITLEPYRIPFDSEAFDVVVSTTVLEHVQDKEECFREIHRVLQPSGSAIHLFPGRWYLPTEPHIYVPLVNWFWPRVPRWWLGLWAFLGIRNQFQRGLSWREVRDRNDTFCELGISYWSSWRYRAVSNRIFGRCFFPMELFVSMPGGGFNALAQKLPFKKLLGLISREFRTAVLVQEKIP